MTADDTRTHSDDTPRFHGRRHGRKLRPGRDGLLAALLPKLRIAPPRDGSVLDPVRLFRRAVGDVWLEVGFGAGEHLAAQAAAHPDIGFVGCEPYVNGVAALLARIEALGLDNVRVFDDDARLLMPALADSSIGRTFILFSDPWPKKRHHARRVISKATLKALARVLKDGAEVRFATDHPEYVRWTLEHVAAEPSLAWTARRPADWRQRPADGFETRYEAKALARGAPCSYLRFRRLPRPEAVKTPCTDGGNTYIRG